MGEGRGGGGGTGPLLVPRLLLENVSSVLGAEKPFTNNSISVSTGPHTLYFSPIS